MVVILIALIKVVIAMAMTVIKRGTAGKERESSNRSLTEAGVQFLAGMSRDIKRRTRCEVRRAKWHLCFTKKVGETVTLRYVSPLIAESAETRVE